MPRHPLIVLRPALATGATATPFVGLPGRGGGRTLDARLPVPAPPLRGAVRPAVHHGGAPAPARTLVDVLAATAAASPHAPALDDGREVLDYRDLLARVSDGARLLARHGVGRGDRVGVRMTSGTADLYVGILAVLSVGAAYVPVDVDDPPERAELVWEQAGVCAVLGDGAAVTPRPVPPRRTGPGLPDPGDDAWIIFTSGSTGTPKGVAVTHRSAAAFVDAEARLFLQHRPVGPGDRVLGGLSVAFDASCEEMWVAWRHGACLVPAARELVRGGVELGDWLAERGVSVVSTVPTLAALWTPEQLRGVRLLILGGEACPEPLAHRLAGACDEVWNTYGPTETTVVACAARLSTDGPVRIGLPLRGWDLAVVDPTTGAVVDEGGSGELVIAGVGTARYLDAEKDAARFAPLPALGWSRAYRSGDLVRADQEGLVYLGRADSQIKIRGFRVELSEIEAVMLELPAIAQAVVSTIEVRPQITELAGWYRTEPGTALDPRELLERLRARLPAHMVPSHLEELAVIPTTTSGKVDRAALPAPRRRTPVRSGRATDPVTATERALSAGLAAVLGLDAVSVTDDLFDDLGASSLALAHLCSEVRATVGPVGIRQVYAHRTLRALAATLDAAGTTAPDAAAAAPPEPPRERPAPVGPLGHACCGAAQVLVLALMAAAGAGAVGAGLAWTDDAPDLPSAFGRAALATLAVVVGLCLLPIAAKWLLVGRWKPGGIRLWSAAYLRFWIVSTLVRSSPLALFAGSPLYLLHLRALGARVGTGSVIVSRTVPVCTDTLTIGAGTVIREGAAFTGYRAEDGVIRVGTVEIGDDAVVGESSYLDVDTAVGDGARLAHASSLHPGQRIPAGGYWHGSPAGPAAAPDPRTLPPVTRGRVRRVLYTLAQLVNLLVVLPLVVAGATVLDSRDPDLDAWTLPGAGALAQSGFYLRELVVSLGLFAAAVVGGLVVVVVVPRLMRPTIVPGRSYPLYGVAWWCHRVVSRVGNAPFFVQLLGDSSYIVGYLRAIGYRASRLGQTGSNAGADLRQHHPHLVTIGRGTMVSDGVGFLTAEVGDSSFRIGAVSLGAHTFLGNQIVVPTGSQLGDNCFVGTKTMVPVDGVLRENTGLLGSPPFPIPRAGQPDSRFDLSRREFGRRLARKNGHNLRSMTLFLGARWARLHVLVMIGLSAGNLYDTLGVGVVAAGAVLAGAVDTALSVLLERASTGFRRLRPQRCSIYDPYFWWHERYWKLSTQPAALNGTTLKPWVWRLLGVRIGRRVFDDGAGISEKSLTSIGDGVALNAGTVLQSHSMEDGVFKSDHVVLGDDVTIGPGAFVHYGVTIGEGAHLSADAFLMKGETVAPGSRWAGNPAQETVAAR